MVIGYTVKAVEGKRVSSPHYEQEGLIYGSAGEGAGIPMVLFKDLSAVDDTHFKSRFDSEQERVWWSAASSEQPRWTWKGGEELINGMSPLTARTYRS